MQAYGRYDFNATANDELSFQKGAMLKVHFDFWDFFDVEQIFSLSNRYSTWKKI